MLLSVLIVQLSKHSVRAIATMNVARPSGELQDHLSESAKSDARSVARANTNILTFPPPLDSITYSDLARGKPVLD
jgi:hypothetical protein